MRSDFVCASKHQPVCGSQLTYTIMNRLNSNQNQWIVPPGRYSATLKQVTAPDPTKVRVVFDLPPQRGLAVGKKAGKFYMKDYPHWLQKDLESWLGVDRLRNLAAEGKMGLAELSTLIGTKAVLVITNEDRGQAMPLVNISEILPHTRENLDGTSTATNNEGPKFRLSFAPPEENDRAKAA